MRPLLYFGLGALALVLFLLDRLIVWAADDPEKPTNCDPEDVPVVEEPGAVTWTLDRDGRLKARKK